MKNYQNARILHDSGPKNHPKYPNFMIFARKINKIPEFYTIFARKMPEFYIKIARKIFFPDFFCGVGGGARAPLTLVSYACN